MAAATVLVALALASPARADTYKIGVLHVDRILQQSQAAKAAHDRIEREFKPRDVAIGKQEQTLRDAQAAYERDRPTLSDEERTARERTLDLQSRDVQRLREQFNEDLRARQFEELDKLKGRLDRIITDYAKANHYDLILQDALWVGSSVDITGDIIKALDASGAAQAATGSGKTR
ncbi:MAG TPA: OmpH family outer membrane protein [Casimicrobiaceae bacterium]|nr:OmpH family outer membrane protein [Casimicrobiaceae bacterium]